jgi:cation:H+ antiporter
MGGDLLVRGAVALARRAHVPPVVIALSIVALGTSLPELVVTVQAVLNGYPGIAIGNVVGSNIANVSLVVAVPAIFYPLTTTDRDTRRDAAIMLIVSLLFLVACLIGDLTRIEGLVLLAGLVAWLSHTARETARTYRERDREAPLEFVLGLPTKGWLIALFVVAGAIGLPLGARMLVEAAVEIAARLGVSDTVVGLTIVAVGTSLPELATSAVAAVQRQTEMVLGTAIGSNVFNILAIMGAAAMVSPAPIPVPHAFRTLDLPVMLLAAVLLAALVWRGRPVGRAAGVVLLAGYGLYLAAVFGLI